MLPDCYFGAYARFDTTSKKDAAILLDRIASSATFSVSSSSPWKAKHAHGS